MPSFVSGTLFDDLLQKLLRLSSLFLFRLAMRTFAVYAASKQGTLILAQTVSAGCQNQSLSRERLWSVCIVAVEGVQVDEQETLPHC